MRRFVVAVPPLLLAAATTAVPATAPLRVYQSLGAVQCGSAGTPVSALAQQLRDAGASVTASMCGSDGRMRPARCGSADGRIGIFEIGADDAAAAARAGFALLATLPDAQVTPCAG